MVAKIKAYKVHAGEPGECAHLCWAEHAGKARSMCRGLDGLDVDFIEIEVERYKAADGLSDVARIAYWLNPDDMRIYRQLGWHCEGESMCEACGLYPCEIPEFEICHDCYCCGACCVCQPDPEETT